ncbi:transcriptional regulator [Arthrobacter sp. MYb211]|uniref:LCP family protein n=1 Tax=unclassified Arthrobacter TaxID=235627 RepID=UPI000CFDD25B|nr:MULTISPECIES: LCP family protein [unclassified Arthrobacter]PRC07922.1 transcriptional regulator [Arthrobacter sp. MYb211]
MTHQRPATPTRKNSSRRKRNFRIIAAALVLALVVGVGAAWFRLQGNISTAAMRATEQRVPDSSRGMNILLLGSDSRTFSSTEFGKDNGSARSDSMVLVHLAADNERIDAVQIPRDTLLEIPACEDTGHGHYAGGHGMINSALNYGPACSVAAVESLTGVNLDHFIEVNFEGFISIVDALDGIDVCLADQMQDPKANLDLPAGNQTVKGEDALALARTRHAVGDGSDIARLGHQQMVMSAVVQRATGRETLTRPDRLYSFLDAVTSSMTVDPGLSSLANLASLATRIQAVPTGEITFMTMPWQPAPQNRNRVVPAPEASTIFERLSADTPVNLGDKESSKAEAAPAASSHEAAVRITNGARVNQLASQFAAKATAQGFSISEIDTAEAPQAATRLLAADTQEARQTAKALAKELDLDLRPLKAPIDGVQLLLGQDYLEIKGAEKAPVKTTNRKASQSLCG